MVESRLEIAMAPLLTGTPALHVPNAAVRANGQGEAASIIFSSPNRHGAFTSYEQKSQTLPNMLRCKILLNLKTAR